MEDVNSVEDLIAQSRGVAPEAIAAGDLSTKDWDFVNKRFIQAEKKHDSFRKNGDPGSEERGEPRCKPVPVGC